MGSAYFKVTSFGVTAEEAFTEAVSEARYQHGNGGYTGTIAEKHAFKVVVPREGETPQECVSRRTKAGIFSDDKWGPAGCVKVGEDQWCFFGWASS